MDADASTEAVPKEDEPSTEVVPVYSLTDPDTWRQILDNGFREGRSLTYMWKNDPAPLIGVPYPYRNASIDFNTRDDIATHLRALGTAIKDYKFDMEGMYIVVENLYKCSGISVFPMVKNIERALFFEQKGRR